MEAAGLKQERFSLEISGVELPSASYKKLKKLPIRASDIAEYLHKDSVSVTEDSVYRILLAHNPAYMNAYKGWGLILFYPVISTVE